MKLNEAIEILEYHQRWRLGKIDEMKYVPKQLTKALDVVLSEFKTKRDTVRELVIEAVTDTERLTDVVDKLCNLKF